MAKKKVWPEVTSDRADRDEESVTGGFEPEPPVEDKEPEAGEFALGNQGSAGNEIVDGGAGEVQTEDKNTLLPTPQENLETVADRAPVSGTLYSIDAGVVTLAKDDGKSPGEKFPLLNDNESDVTVTVNGKETLPGDLKRGDNVILYGDPVNEIEATRS